jgi:hypothetical protein
MTVRLTVAQALPVSEPSALESTQRARVAYKAAKRAQRSYL